MWICLNNAFLSIVSKDCAADELLVRARRPNDITNAFPGATVTVKPHSDYQFRAVIKRAHVAETLASKAMEIQYDNFKDSVRDDDLHDAYAKTWHIMARMQPRPPYSSYGPEKPRKTAAQRRLV